MFFIYPNLRKTLGYLEYSFGIMILMIDMQIYDQWNKIKKSIQQKDRLLYFKERQIWWCNVGQNLGSEVYGKGNAFTRPVLVYKKLSKELFLGIPLTSKVKEGTWYQGIKFGNKYMTALLNQVRIFDLKRMINRIGQISDRDFNKIKTGFNSLYLS